MKKIPVIAILLLFFIAQAGYNLSYFFKSFIVKEQARLELKSSLPDAYFTRISMQDNISAIIWEDEGTEFSLHGQMYDVARIKKESGKDFIYCYNDLKEDALIDALVKQINDEERSGKRQTILKFQVPDWINTIPPALAPVPAVEISQEYHPRLDEKVYSLAREVASPPPDPANHTKNPAGFLSGILPGGNTSSENTALAAITMATFCSAGLQAHISPCNQIPAISFLSSGKITFNKSIRTDTQVCMNTLFIPCPSLYNGHQQATSPVTFQTQNSVL